MTEDEIKAQIINASKELMEAEYRYKTADTIHDRIGEVVWKLCSKKRDKEKILSKLQDKLLESIR